jgi:hypothetical protein
VERSTGDKWELHDYGEYQFVRCERNGLGGRKHICAGDDDHHDYDEYDDIYYNHYDYNVVA